MATELEIVNDCLATLGEAPLNSLLEPHEFRGTAQRLIARVSEDIQATGWWFNIENLTLSPSPTGEIQLPTDCLKWQSGVRRANGGIRDNAMSWIVERGGRLYDTARGTYALESEITGELVRLIPLADVPSVVNRYIAAMVVLKFQSNFDADNNRREELSQAAKTARTEARAENIRQLSVNLINNNTRLSRIKSVTRRAR